MGRGRSEKRWPKEPRKDQNLQERQKEPPGGRKEAKKDQFSVS